MTVGAALSSQCRGLVNSAESISSAAFLRRTNRSAPDASCRPVDRSDRAGESTTTLRYRRSERTTLYIETQEGDVVRLRIKLRESLAAERGGAGSNDVTVHAGSQLRVSLEIEGDLSPDELEAIQSVVGQAASLAEDFFAGNLPDAFAAASALEIDGSQLARVGLKLHLREQATYSGAPRPAAAASARPPTGPAAPTPEPATAEPAAALPPSATTGEPNAAEGPATPEAAATAAPTAAPASSADARANASAAALVQIADFLHGLLETLRATPESPEAAPSLGMSLKLQLYRATLVEVAASLPADSSATTRGVPLAADALEALAAGQAAPLEARA